MILQSKKNYQKDKLFKTDNLYRDYQHLFWLFDSKKSYLFKENNFYEKMKTYKLQSKKEIINNYWVSFWNSILFSKKINYWYLKNNISFKYKYEYSENNIINLHNNWNHWELDKIYQKNKTYLFNKWIFLVNIQFLNGEEKTYQLKIKEIFGSEDRFFQIFNSLSLFYLIYFWEFRFKNSVDLHILNHLKKFFTDKKNEKILYLSYFLPQDQKEKLFNKIEDYLLFSIPQEKTINKSLLNKKRLNFLIKHNILENFKEWKEYTWTEILSLLNKKDKSWNLPRKYYSTAPKWYRKIENKRLKNSYIQNLRKHLNKNEIENIDLWKYVHNWNRYW